MMDQSITRRGQPCWYKLENVGLMSCNDAILLDQENYHILQLFFSDKKYYQKIVDLMHETSRYTSYGQCMDTASHPPNQKPQFHLFSQLRYDSIVKYKTAYYSFVLPVRLGLTTSCDGLIHHIVDHQEVCLKELNGPPEHSGQLQLLFRRLSFLLFSDNTDGRHDCQPSVALSVRNVILNALSQPIHGFGQLLALLGRHYRR
ncbi:unnamed protein product [Oppiella nova]|uniref:Uncharacterized protein n=1 Tax=Oppiella nova TaxID=334625 RepID=A0A7R9MCU2_9ACAR|nr:unnamed protein product [Oppiella nova]CAG2174886.1 unnamed protein product [Oppiella nova]